MNRYDWMRAVLKQPDLHTRAKALASVLAVSFANDDTGQINPGLDTLADAMGCSVDTIRRAVGDLEAGGWLARTVHHGRGKTTCFVLLSPGAVVALRPIGQAPKAVPAPAPVADAATPKRSQARKVSARADAPGKGRSPAPKRSQTCKPHYKAGTGSEQEARERPAARPSAPPSARPSPHLRRIVQAGSPQAEAWQSGLRNEGLPPLDRLHGCICQHGFDMPWAWPPNAADTIGRSIARNVALWASAEGGARDAA